MSISFEVRVHAGHVVLECTGTYTFESSLQIFSQAFENAVRAGRGAVLVDVCQLTGGPPTLLDRYRQVMHIAGLQSSRGPRIRFAIFGHEPMIHPHRFGDVIAMSRGAPARAFTDLDEAMAWLNS